MNFFQRIRAKIADLIRPNDDDEDEKDLVISMFPDSQRSRICAMRSSQTEADRKLALAIVNAGRKRRGLAPLRELRQWVNGGG
jgi:hypothetical protein